MLELMLLMLVAKHRAVAADRFLASVAVIVQLGLVVRAHLFAGTRGRRLHVLDGIRDLFKDSEVYKLRNPE